MNNPPPPPPLDQSPHNPENAPVVQEIDLNALLENPDNISAKPKAETPPDLPQHAKSSTAQSGKRSRSLGSLIVAFCLIGGGVWYFASQPNAYGPSAPPELPAKEWKTELKMVETPAEEHLVQVLLNRKPEKDDNPEEILRALEHVDNVNLMSEDSCTILSYLVGENDITAVRILLLAKANPNIDPKINPVQLAINKKNTAILNLLLEAGASPYPNEKRQDANPLQSCLDNSYLDGVSTLLKHGYDPNVKFKAYDKDAPPIHPLFYAALSCKNQPEEICSLLIKYGAKLNDLQEYNVKDGQKLTHNLITAVTNLKVNEEFQSWLIKKVIKVDKNAVNYIIPETGQSATQIAVLFKDLKTVKLLLSLGADPNIGTYSPIYSAAIMKDVEAIKLLLDAGADPNKAPEGKSNKSHPLIYALTCLEEGLDASTTETVRVLLSSGCSPKECDAAGVSPIITLLSEEKLTDATKSAILQQLLKYGADPEASTAEKGYPLYISLLGGSSLNRKLAEELINAGTDVNTKFQTTSSLGHACLQLRPDVVKFLLSHGATINITDNNGDAPLVMVIKNASNNSNNAVECIRLLLEAGADKKDARVQSAVKKCANEEVKELLIIRKPKIKGVLADISTGNAAAGKKSIEAIEKALKNADEKDKPVLTMLKNVVREIYTVRAKEKKTKELNQKDNDAITKCINNARRNASSRHIGGGSAISMAIREQQKAEMLENKIQNRNNALQSSKESVISHIRTTIKKLNEAGRTDDAEVLEACLSHFGGSSDDYSDDPFAS